MCVSLAFLEVRMLLLVFGLIFFLCYVMTPIVTAFSWRIGAVDIPQDWRRMHCESVPRGGGLAIILPFAVGCCLLARPTGLLFAALCGGLLMLAVGLLDDVYCLGPRIKLILQLAAGTVAILLSGEVRIGYCAAAVLWVCILTNAHNFIDGLDGLLTGCCCVEALMLGGALLLTGERGLAQAAALLAVCCMGFRPYNRHPARVFAGDCGSESLGFLLGMLSLPLLFGGTGFSALSPVFLFAYPLADMTAAVLRRILRGKNPFCADRGHLHHRLYAAGLSVPACVGVLVCASLTLGVIGVLLLLERLWLLASMVCLFAVFLFVGVRNYVAGERNGG